MKTADFEYDLPAELIAQKPAQPRDSARLLVLNRSTGKLSHARFHQLDQFLEPGDVLVLNRTRVIPARLYARKIPTGGRVEVLLLRREDPQVWEVLVGGKGLTQGVRLDVEGVVEAQVVQVLDGPRRRVRFSRPLDSLLAQIGHVPLPPYIKEPLEDGERYQTVYAREPGSAAAPTAGLHFTRGMIERMRVAGFVFVEVTLHIGLDTFAPVTEAHPTQHKIHSEWCHVPASVVAAIQAARRSGRRVVAVGTTSVRALETAGQGAGGEAGIGPYQGATDLFILPGYEFRVVDAMITNFHLPRSTLLMLVSAFAGRERVLETYRIAIQQGYRFYSFGDAMLIL